MVGLAFYLCTWVTTPHGVTASKPIQCGHQHLLKSYLIKKPRNVSYLFGAVDEFVGVVKGDVAVICTRSDVEGMKLIAQQFAPNLVLRGPLWSAKIFSATSADERRQYIGQFSDSLGLEYLNARNYNPTQGRFPRQYPTCLAVGNPAQLQQTD